MTEESLTESDANKFNLRTIPKRAKEFVLTFVGNKKNGPLLHIQEILENLGLLQFCQAFFRHWLPGPLILNYLHDLAFCTAKIEEKKTSVFFPPRSVVSVCLNVPLLYNYFS